MRFRRIYIHWKRMEVWTEIARDAESGARRLVAEYGGRLFAAARLVCSDDRDAEELVFRTFERAIRKIRQYEPKGGFFPWLYAIMLNFRRMDLRRRRVATVPLGGAADLPETAAEQEAPGGGTDEVWNAMRALPPVLRETVAAKYFAQRSVEEIASDDGVPPGTVKSRLHKARRLLADALSANGKETGT